MANYCRAVIKSPRGTTVYFVFLVFLFPTCRTWSLWIQPTYCARANYEFFPSMYFRFLYVRFSGPEGSVHKNIKLFRLVFCLFQFNWNIETLCFTIEAKQPKQSVIFQNKPKQTQTNRNNPKFSEKIPKYALYQTVSCFGCSSVCFGSIETRKLSVSV